MSFRTEKHGDTLTVYVDGMLNAVSAPELEKTLSEAMGDTEELILDLEKLEYISSAGLRVLITIYKKMDRRGTIRLTHVNVGVKEVFDVTGLSSVFSIET